MSTPDNNDHGPGEKAIMGVAAAVGGGLLLWAIEQGDSAAFFLFLVILVWTVAKYTRIWHPWGAVAAVVIGWGAYSILT